MDSASLPGDPAGFEEVHDRELPPSDRQPLTVEQLVQQIKMTADKLIRDRASRGDVKLLTTALKELRYCFKVFAAYRERRKVTVFGSARLPLDHPACVQAVEFGKRMAEANFMVITGAAAGIMEAGHIGAGREQSVGVNILLPFEQGANSIIGNDNKLMHLKYFFTRKLLFVKESDAIALFPGGFGTLDEGFEVLTLIQTGKSHLFPIVLVDEPGGDYWKQWLAFIKSCLLDRGLISPDDMHLFKVTDSVEEAVQEVLGFYRVYHSMRFVHGNLVLRLLKALSDEALECLNDEFHDIVTGGRIEQSGALPEEVEDKHLAHLARLRFSFNRRNLGRLRQLIDAVNRAG